jgi:hypothetical protein
VKPGLAEPVPVVKPLSTGLKVPAAKSAPAKSGVPAAIPQVPVADTGKQPPGPGAMPSISDDVRQSHPGLRVIVGLKAPGPVNVRVLDTSGTEVRKLYSGEMQAGRWAFEWDGFLGDGMAAIPGRYLIEVQSGGVTQYRSVVIK